MPYGAIKKQQNGITYTHSLGESVNRVKERRLCRSEAHASVEEVLYKHGYQYVAYLGLRKKRAAQNIGIYCANQGQKSEWPYQVQSNKGHPLLWITKVTQQAVDRNNFSVEMQIARDYLQTKIPTKHSTTPTLARTQSGKKIHPAPQFDRAIPKRDELSLTQLASELSVMGHKLMANGFMDSATQEFQQAKNLLEAEMAKKQSKKRQKMLVLLLNNLAFLHLQLNNMDDAKQSAERVLEMEAANVKALLARSLANFQLDNYHDSRRDLCHLVELQTDRKDIAVLLQIMELAITYRNVTRSQHSNDDRKDNKFWSILPDLIKGIRKDVKDAAREEPHRKDVALLLTMVNILDDAVKEVVQMVSQKSIKGLAQVLLERSDRDDFLVPVGWLNVVLQATNDIIRFGKDWLLERDAVGLTLRMLGLVIAAKRAFL
ncbi:uncharacterized protein LOC129586609 isoform X2 [Paramacrobiotus metropolitanus]|uniref:uncharacterized protein LOC129586609 isoform X2 n=1 Tax=Paramacrobiotus metropolitanus TaxID=2943436 RepID=UPI00244563BE|nr:uncharacterized protein LOC129586609 isoform X2 [Paramacrobiotus metropolitanus]